MAFETEKDLTPEEEPVTSRDESGEPSGEEDPANEEERIVDDQPQDYLAMAQRIQADFENYRKRVVRETAGAGERGRGCPGPRPPADRRQPRARTRVRRGR